MKKAATNSYSTGCESDEFFSVAKKLEPNLTNGSHAKIFANGPFSSSSAATTLLFNQQTSSSLLFTVISVGCKIFVLENNEENFCFSVPNAFQR
jgi:hypothetical protein